VNRYRREAERPYQVLNEHLEGRTYIVGETYTIADISAWGWVDRASRVRKGGDDPLGSFPNLKATVLGFGARRDSMRVFERNDGDPRRMERPSSEKARTRPMPSDIWLDPALVGTVSVSGPIAPYRFDCNEAGGHELAAFQAGRRNREGEPNVTSLHRAQTDIIAGRNHDP
jgi:hypothetical protein